MGVAIEKKHWHCKLLMRTIIELTKSNFKEFYEKSLNFVRQML